MQNKFVDIKNISDTEAEIYIYGEIVATTPVDWLTGEEISGYVGQDSFLSEIKELKNKQKITVRINSVGGSMYVGLAMYSLLKSLPGEKIVIVDGLAASAASVVMMAGDTIKVPVGSMVMIHEAAVGLCGYFNKADVEPLGRALDTMNNAAADHYAARTGLDSKEILEMMNAETWMGSSEAVAKGFADEILYSELELVMSADKQTICSNGVEMSLSGIKNMPDLPVKITNKKREMEARLKQAGFSNSEAVSIASIYGKTQSESAQSAALSELARDKEALNAIKQITSKIIGDNQ